MGDGLNEATIVRGLRVGDRDAWDALCQQYSGRVWRYVARLIGRDEQAVADVFQETMLAVAKSGRGIAEGSKLWAWLAAISHNQAALYWRKRYRDRGTSLDAAQIQATSDDDPIAALSQQETVTAVRCLLAEMSGEHVAVLTAKYLDGLTVPQIVAALGGTHESVRSRLARARQDFRRRYERLTTKEGERAASALPDVSPQKSDFS